jgi:hypothetical protein
MSEMSELLEAMPLHYTPRRSFNLLTMILIKDCFVLYHLLVCCAAYNISPPSLLLYQFPHILRKLKTSPFAHSGFGHITPSSSSFCIVNPCIVNA